MTEAPDPPELRRHGLAAFGVANYRLYWTGQLLGQTGTWFQNLAIALLIVHLTGSASALALVTVAQFGPMLLLAPLAGRLADRVRPRSILIATSALLGTVALLLAWEVSHEQPALPVVYGLIVCSGIVTAFDRVAGQAIIYELVGGPLLQSGVVLSTVYISAARSIGPGLAGLAVLLVGPAACLVINAASYLVVLAALLSVRTTRMFVRPAPEGERTSIFGDIRASARNRPLLVLLLVNVFVTITAYNFNVVLTAAVTLEFAGDAGALGATHALNAVGAVIGGLVIAWAVRVRVVTVVPALLAFALALALNAAAPTLPLFLLAAPVLGVGLGVYQAVLQSAAQGASPPWAIGRTMSLVSLGNIGMAPIGAILAGALIDLTSPRTALGVGALACLLAAAGAWVALRRLAAARPIERGAPA